MDEWLTTRTVSRALHVSEHSLRLWLRQGRVPGAVKLPNGEWRWPPDAYKHLLRTPERLLKEAVVL
jgi:predicted site-specific integrase-resolvase